MGSIFHLLIVLVTGLAASTLVFRLQYSDSATNPQVLYRTEKHGQEWQPIHHLGGNEPWFSKKADIVAPGTDVLPGCRVDQVHMISRHAERYPTCTSGIRMLELYHRMKKSNVTFSDDLEFVNDWEFLTLDPSLHFENLVSTGPNAGTLQAFRTGIELRTRYHDLLNGAVARGQTTYWASDSARVIESARYFAAGFFGLDNKRKAQLEIIPETRDVGGNTLTPGKSCRKYVDNADDYGHNLGARKLLEFRSTYIPQIISRLMQAHPDFVFTESEVYSMQELCGFEILAKGRSRWCEVFTKSEMQSFEYARDLLHYYKTGPGNPYGPTMGGLWLNATANLLQAGPAEGALFFSFVHDGDIIPLVATLGLFHQEDPLPTTHIHQGRHWRTSDVVPMGGRLIFERLACRTGQVCWSDTPLYPNHVYCKPNSVDETFIRLNINDGIVALPNCTSGPGKSCPLEEFLSMVKQRGKKLPEFRELCGLDEDSNPGITFLHQHYDS